MSNKKNLIIFLITFLIAFFYWRLRVFLKYNDGDLPFLRELTGLTIHHYHYGLIMMILAGLLLIFYKKELWVVGLMGFGMGSVLDSFVSGLVKANTDRVAEITRYSSTLFLTILIFISVIILTIILYLLNKNLKTKEN
jgi:hypothetical protein